MILIEKLKKLKEKMIINKGNELEQCVLCWKFTDIKKSTPVDLRKFYVEGSGQLCKNCYNEVYYI